MMKKVLIVDDEILTIEYLKRMSVWEKFQCSEVLHAVTARKALEIFEKEKPDIVFLDIRIPKINGLELGRRFLKIQPGVSIVIMTAYQEFEYVKEAMEIGIKYFLVKHEISEAAMGDVLGKIMVDIQQCRTFQKAMWDEALREIWDVGTSEHAEINAWFSEKKRYLLAEAAFGMFSLLPGKEKKIRISEQILDESDFHGFERKAFTRLGGNVYGMIWEYTAPESVGREELEINRFARTLRDAFSEKTEIPPDLFLARLHREPFEDIRRYISGYRWAVQLIPLKDTGIFRMDREEVPETAAASDLYQGMMQIGWTFRQLEILMERMNCRKYVSAEVLQPILEFISENQLQEKILEMDSVRTIACVQEFVIACAICSREKKKSNESKLTANVIQYIKQNFAKDITSGMIAQELHVSEGYLRTVFKKDMGLTVKEYILQHQIEYAKKLLKEDKKRIYEIAKLCGFSSSQHFCRAFRRETGMAPGDFNKKGKVSK